VLVVAVIVLAVTVMVSVTFIVCVVLELYFAVLNDYVTVATMEWEGCYSKIWSY
jgi:hypothetical protein